MSSKGTWKQAWRSPCGRLLLCFRILAFVAGAILYIWGLPWLVATPIRENYDNLPLNPPPPSWARSFAISHGQARYYPNSIRDNPWKAGSWAAGLIVLWVVEVLLVRRIRRLASRSPE
ncbi:MAG: hypothetical protein QM755_19730 [Luteolibacter sp.]